MATRKQFHILGGGSIGLLYAASIQSFATSYAATVLLREHHRERLRGRFADPSKWRIRWQRPSWPSPQPIFLPVEYSSPKELKTTIHTLVVTTKSYQAKEAVQSVLHRLDPKISCVWILCNGALSVRDELSPLLQDIPLYVGTTTHGAFQEDHTSGDCLLRHAGIGQTFLPKELGELEEMIHTVGLTPCVLEKDAMEELLWKKLAANCVINPLTAIHECTNGGLFHLSESLDQWQDPILDEIVQVAGTIAPESISASLNRTMLKEFVQTVIQGTLENRSSMWSDVMQSKRTEVEALNGYVVRKGQSLGINCPANQELVERQRKRGWGQLARTTAADIETTGAFGRDNPRLVALSISTTTPPASPSEGEPSSHSKQDEEEVFLGNFDPLTDTDVSPSIDDLAAALVAIGLSDENEIESPSVSPLPNIEIPEFETEDPFLLSPEDLEGIFDESPTSVVSPTLLPSSDPVGIDQDTNDLYLELAQLSLGPTASPEPFDDNMETTVDGLPIYMICQPCTPDAELFGPLPFNLSSIGEDSPLDNLQVDRSPQLEQAAREFQALLEEDPASATALLRLDEGDAIFQDDFQESPPLRPSLKQAADPFLKAFGVVPNHPSVADTLEEPSSALTNPSECLMHRETIFASSFSPCGRYCATASQDATIGIWKVDTHSLLSKFQDHDANYECLRVAWASPSWAKEVLDRSPKSVWHYILATSGADGVVKMWSCVDPSEGQWMCQFTLDHSKWIAGTAKAPADTTKTGEKEDSSSADAAEAPEDNKPQTYTLQFVDHWQAFTLDEATSTKVPTREQNSFMLTSSDDLVHLWELDLRPSTSDASKITLGMDPDGLRLQLKRETAVELREVMSLHFGPMEYAGYGVNVCSFTGEGLSLPAPPLGKNVAPGRRVFGGERNPENKIFVFDSSYCPATGVLGVALSDGSLRLINGRGLCVSVLNLPGCQSHLTSFGWDSTGTRIATTVATGHLITWKLDLGNVQGNGKTVAVCTSILEGGHAQGRPLYGTRYCGEKEQLLLSWGVDGNLCLWDSEAEGNIYAPLALLKADSNYPIYTVDVSKDCLAVGGGGEGGFIGIPLYMYQLPEPSTSGDAERKDESQTTTTSPRTSAKRHPDEETSIPTPLPETWTPATQDSDKELLVPQEKKSKTEETSTGNAIPSADPQLKK
eukprot:Nitzschia sp. Nitz4//scaffold156_size52432//14687//18335//NITZ4_006824-RA/size52432-snap-gene-0.9-mRNA-1//1//CDS//3329537406//8477//frame0